MQGKRHSQPRLVQEINIEAIVPQNYILRLKFDDPIPDRTTLVKLRRLWSKTGVFADVMHEVVKQCVDAGLVSGKAIGVDGTQVTANAATNSLAPMAPVISVTQWVTRKQEADATEDGTKEPLTDPGDGPSGAGSGVPAPSATSQRQAGDPNFHDKKFSNGTHRSKTDPDGSEVAVPGPQRR